MYDKGNRGRLRGVPGTSLPQLQGADPRGARVGESKTAGWAGEEEADRARDPRLEQLLQVPWMEKGAEVPHLPTRPWNPAPPNMCEAREDRGSSQIARPPAPSPKLEGKYLLCLRTRYKLILNNTDALFFLLCPDRNAVANLDML